MRSEPFDALGVDGIVATRVVYYAALYPHLREVARQHGYALALHGSLTKDLDVLAVPWTEEASTPIVLVRALIERCGGLMAQNNPTLKPHGRTAWTIMLADGAGYIDLAVMPREEP